MINTKIKIYRIKKGLTQKQLAIKCNLSQSHISALENNLESPTIKTLESISKALNICIFELLEHKCSIKCTKTKDKACSCIQANNT